MKYNILAPLRYTGVTFELIRELREAYPPRPLGHNEAVEDHLRFAGKIELIEELAKSLPPGGAKGSIEVAGSPEAKALADDLAALMADNEEEDEG